MDVCVSLLFVFCQKVNTVVCMTEPTNAHDCCWNLSLPKLQVQCVTCRYYHFRLAWKRWSLYVMISVGPSQLAICVWHRDFLDVVIAMAVRFCRTVPLIELHQFISLSVTIMAVPISFKWTFYVLIWLSLNFVNFPSASRVDLFFTLMYKGDNMISNLAKKRWHFLGHCLSEVLQTLLICNSQYRVLRFILVLDLVSRSQVCWKHKLQNYFLDSCPV